MRKTALSFLLTLAFAVTVCGQSRGFVEGELLIKYKNGTVSEAARVGSARIGASVVQEFPEIGWQLVKLPDNLSVAEALQTFRFSADVEFVQPNYIYKLAATPNDPSYGSLWGMAKINAPTAWDISTGSESVVVAVIDTGIRATHEDLAANLWRNTGETPGNGVDDDQNGYVDDLNGYDFANNDADPADDYDHGAHVAGTIGAVGNNGKGVVGVNWNVRLMTLKIHDAAGNSSAAKLIQAFTYVRMMKLRGVSIRVTNNSYGGAPEAPGYDQATKDAIDAAGEADILNCFAAGNSGTNNDVAPFYPASYDSPSILAVAASNSSDNRQFNYGANSVDLAAPGVGILSATRFSDTSYGNKSGTSMATPHVAGAAALLAAAQPNLSAASLKATLMNRVDQLSQWNGFVKTGGRLNVLNALQNPTVCNFNLSAASQNVAAAGGRIIVNVTAANNCDFSVVSQAAWAAVSSGNPGSGNTIVAIDVSQNTGAARSAIIKIAGQNFVVAQSGAITAANPVLDFDGDGKTDYSVVQNSNGAMVWHNYGATSGYRSAVFGLFAGDTLVPADYDGDGKADLAVWRGGATGGQAYFYVLNSSNNTVQSAAWGAAGDVPQTAQDFNGDERADFVVTRQVNNALIWFVLYSNNNGFFAQQFGAAGDKPIRGDFDGDNKADLAVYRPANASPANTFLILKSSDGILSGISFGSSATDRIVSADFDGDRKTDVAVWRATTGVWYWLESASGQFRAVQFGASGDFPAVGDYDGDGKDDPAVWRANAATGNEAYFYMNGSTAGFSAFGWGNSTMKPAHENLQIGF